MGRQLVDYLQLAWSHVQVFTVNRGRTYWSDARKPSLVADRRNASIYKTAIEKIMTENAAIRWKGIIDFCAFGKGDIEDALPDCVFAAFPVYVLISTDSVYEVIPHIGRLVGSVDEAATDTRDKLIKKIDEYGHDKLMAEQALMRRAGSNQSLFVLRLPDVIGEFDDTGRFWSYKLWIESGVPLHIPPGASQKLAFVYAGDVVRFTIGLIERVVQTGLRETMNICCTEQVSLVELLGMIGSCCGKQVQVERGSNSFYPSVEQRKGVLSIVKAERFGWRPTPLAQAVNQTVTWLHSAETIHLPELRDFLKGLPKPVRNGLASRFPIEHLNRLKRTSSSSDSSDSSSDSSDSSRSSRSSSSSSRSSRSSD